MLPRCTLQTSRVFEVDAYDTLITEATSHGAKLLKKPHQTIAVLVICGGRGRPQRATARGRTTKKSECHKDREAGAFPHQDSKQVLECLQKTLRIATSATGDIVTIQLYCRSETLDQYLYYFDHGAPAIAPKYIISLVELIASSIGATAEN
ncbi:vacuolar protein sorting-associated protein 35 [Pisolithus microcarpus]|nr:vacuolar protein sorting-associated protein 35 [Pisolithus microcarpus]